MRRSSAFGISALLVSVASLTASASAAVINVPSAQAPTITIAINIASSGDEIVVAPGTYFEAMNLSGKTLAIRSSDGPEVTILDGLGQFKPVISIVTNEGPATLIEGFTIRNGVATAPAPDNVGGGIRSQFTSPTIRNCVFENNVAVAGGGVYAQGGAPTLVGCRFIGNQTPGGGDGGALNANNAVVTLTDCEFIDNSAGRHGGAIRGIGSTRMIVTNTHFLGNAATNNGGAIDIAANAGAYEFHDCRFIGNSAGARGGVLHVATSPDWTHLINNCLFHSNDAGTYGGVAYHLGRALYRNCTIADNVSVDSGGAIFASGTGSHVDLRNCIVWGNAPNGLIGPNLVVRHTCTQTIIWAEGNIFEDPLFVDPTSGDYRLEEASPCIDAGDTTVAVGSVATDLDGLPRAVTLRDQPTGTPIFGYFIDMGAFEYPAAPTPPACLGDLNGDGVVNGADLGIMLNAWGFCR